MAALKAEDKIAVIGAGTMGAGIAQVAADAGHNVMLFDIADGAAEKGVAGVAKGLARLVEKGKRTQAEVAELLARIHPVQELAKLADCSLVIEAIVENLEVKRKVIADLEAMCSSEAIIASNTSSISISALGAEATKPERIVGMHFFNPAAILKLVEVISGLQTSSDVAQTVFDTAAAWGKSPVHAKSTPGFIVNRVARPFYAEALRSLNEQAATVPVIDAVMRECGGFKMGPLELIDLIGQDINCAVTESVYEAYFQDKRFQPSVLQKEMVDAGLLGRKSGRGFYDYSGDKQQPKFAKVVDFQAAELQAANTGGALDGLLERVRDAGHEIKVINADQDFLKIGEVKLQQTDGRTATECAADQNDPNLVLFDYVDDWQETDVVAIAIADQASPTAAVQAAALLQSAELNVALIKDLPGMLVMRTLVMLVNEAYDAVNQGVCEELSADIAMKGGVSYPKGPIEWGKRIGEKRVVDVLQNLQVMYGEERYRISPLLRRRATVNLFT